MKKIKLKINCFWKKNKQIVRLFNILGIDNLKIVGGAVRAALNNEETKDLDLAINLSPSYVKKKLRLNKIKFLDKSSGHGTVSIYSKDCSIEITSLRKDIKTFGRKAAVEYISSFTEDSRRRDFTINSMYSDLDGNLYDPYGGVKDLEKKTIKFIGKPEERINEDFLRIFRYFRMLGLYSFSQRQIDKNSLKACVLNFYKIKFLSKERMQLEFNKFIKTDNIDFTLFILKKNNLLDMLIKGLQKISYASIKQIKILPKEIYIRMAYLLYKTGINIDTVNQYLNLSNRDIMILKKVLSIKKRIITENQAKIYKYNFGKEVALINYMLLQFVNNKSMEKKILFILEKWSLPKLPVNGIDVIEMKSVKGKEVGVILDRLEKWWVQNHFTPTRSQCLEKLKMF